MLIKEKSRIDTLVESDAFTSRVDILREDLLHPIVSGNKWRKLKYHVEKANQRKKDTLISWGGAFSNHLHALAFAANELNFKSIGLIRGEIDRSNPSMKDCIKWGMTLEAVPRSEYACRNDKAIQSQISLKYPNAYLIPEGGSGYLGIMGCTEILVNSTYDVVCVSSGTGATAAGVLLSSRPESEVWIFPANGNAAEAERLVRAGVWSVLIDETAVGECMKRARFLTQDALGGFASLRKELFAFMNSFNEEYGIQLDSVYTGRMMFQLNTLSKELEGKSTLCIHTGGTQGNRGMNERIRKKGWEELV